MDKLFELNKKIGLCFQKINYIKYFQSTDEEKDTACRKERDDYIEYVNSDALNFKNVVEEKYKKILGIIKFNYFFCFMHNKIIKFLKKLSEREEYIEKNY